MFRPLAIALLVFMPTTFATAQDGKIPFQVVPLSPTLGLPESHDNFVIRSAEQWYVWVNDLTAIDEPLPTIDFEQYTALVASAGYKEHGPVVLTFDSISDAGNVIRVHVSVPVPHPALRNPFQGITPHGVDSANGQTDSIRRIQPRYQLPLPMIRERESRTR